VFFARRYFYHALFDGEASERWSCYFQDPLDPDRSPHLLLDHILFSQALTRGYAGVGSPYIAEAGSGKVEHQIHHRVASSRYKYAETSDHRPISMTFRRRDTPQTG